MSDWPRTYVPLGPDGQPDPDRTHVELFQHRPGQTDALLAWTGGRRVIVNNMPAVVLPNGDPVGLGDFALRYPAGRLRVEYADGIATRYQPLVDDEPTS